MELEKKTTLRFPYFSYINTLIKTLILKWLYNLPFFFSLNIDTLTKTNPQSDSSDEQGTALSEVKGNQIGYVSILQYTSEICNSS